MTHDLAPLTLPDSDWEGWLARRCDTELGRAAAIVEELKEGGRRAAPTMALWNDVNLALSNAFAAASLLSNVHPDEAVRYRGERAEQDAQKLLTEIGLDRELFEVLDAVDATALDDGGRRVLTLALRDFRRAGVDQDDDVRARIRVLSERQTEVGQRVRQDHPRGRPQHHARARAARRAARRLRRGAPAGRGRPGRRSPPSTPTTCRS